MSNLKEKLDHSIFIPTKNRPKWIEYSLLHYDSLNYNGTIIIYDDSDSEYYLENSKIILKFSKKLNIEHVKGEGSVSKMPRHKNMIASYSNFFRNIKTKYYTQASDDDVVYTPNIKFSINFLEKNKSYVAVSGNFIQGYLDDDYNFIKVLTYLSPACHYDDPLDRLTCYANEGGHITYGVIRTESNKALWDLEKKLGWPLLARKNNYGIEYFDAEIPWVARIYISGKIANLNLLQNVRLKSDDPFLDRDELSYKRESLKDNMVLGNISGVMNDTLSSACIETFKEFQALINYEKSKYEPDIIDYQIKQFIWSSIKGYDGAGLNRNNIESSRDFKKKKDIINNINLSNFFKIFNLKKIDKIIVLRLSFKIHLFKTFRKFKKNHNVFKKVFVSKS